MTPNKDQVYGHSVTIIRVMSGKPVMRLDEMSLELISMGTKGLCYFQDENDGRAALARQLLLYMDRGNNTSMGL